MLDTEWEEFFPIDLSFLQVVLFALSKGKRILCTYTEGEDTIVKIITKAEQYTDCLEVMGRRFFLIPSLQETV